MQEAWNRGCFEKTPLQIQDQNSSVWGVILWSMSISKDEPVLLHNEQQRCSLWKTETLTIIKDKEGGKAVGCELEWILLGHFLSVLGYFWNEHRK